MTAFMHEPARGSSPTCTRKSRRAAAKYAPASRWTRFLRRRWDNTPSSRRWKWPSSRRNRRAPATRVTRATTPARSAGGARRRRCRWRTTRARCSSGCSAIPEAQTRRRGSSRIQQDRSILDSVISEVAHLQQSLGQGDRGKLTEYLDAISDVERRIQKAEEQSDQELPLVAHPAGIPATYDEHAKLMIDLQVLAYQCDLTRIITLHDGPRVQRHDVSADRRARCASPDLASSEQDPEKVEKVAKINTYHVTLFAYMLEKLRATPDGDGSLLDHVMMMYGAGMADSNAHAPVDLPIVLAGGGAGSSRAAGTSGIPSDTPLANLHLTLLDRFGVPWDRLGDSTGKLDDLHLSGI